jgi:hypothetical protein
VRQKPGCVLWHGVKEQNAGTNESQANYQGLIAVFKALDSTHQRGYSSSVMQKRQNIERAAMGMCTTTGTGTSTHMRYSGEPAA